jgi:hypothetical protein
MAENIVTQKVGPLPLVVWVAGGSGLILLVLLMSKHSSNSSSGQQNATNQVSSLAPTEAEAFGTIEQQQQDVTNALATLGNNQSALGGSMSTLTGIVTQQGQDNAAAFQNLVNGQNTIEQGQSSAASAADNYYNSLLANMGNYANSLGVQISGVSGQVSGVQSSVNGLTSLSTAQYNQLVGIATNPWVKAWYQNQALANLSPYEQQQFWNATGLQAQGQPI